MEDITIVSIKRFLQAMDKNIGFCKKCKDFTRECTDDFAEGLNCSVCETSNSVVGPTKGLNIVFETKPWSCW